MNAFQLKNFAVTRLHVDCHEPKTDGPTSVAHIASAFGLAVLVHRENPREFKIEFTGRFRQLAATEEVLGYEVEIRIAAFAEIGTVVPEEKLIDFVHANAANTLYGTCRGLIASATGVFPFGPLILPSISAKEILASVQVQPVQAQSTAQPKARPIARRAVTPTRAPAASRK